MYYYCLHSRLLSDVWTSSSSARVRHQQLREHVHVLAAQSSQRSSKTQRSIKVERCRVFRSPAATGTSTRQQWQLPSVHASTVATGLQTHSLSHRTSLLSASQKHRSTMPIAQPAKPCRSSSSLGPSKHNPAAQDRSSSKMHASSGSDSPSGSDSEYTSKQEADQTVKRLQRLNSIQKGYCDRQDSRGQQDDRSICCWGKGEDGQPRDHTSRRGVANQVQLSVYPDAIGDNLSDLEQFLRKHIDGAIGSIHLLPLYPSTGDRGFAPITYQEVDPDYGTWENVKDLGSEYQLCLEFMANHISPASEQFKHFVQNGEESRFRDMFVHWEDIWPEGKPSAEQLARIRTRKPAPPVIEITLADGSKVPLWNTFKDQQIDINPFSEEGWKFVETSLVSLCERGKAKLIRLDAFGYVTKKPGTGCFMEEPEVWDLLNRIRDVVKPYGVEVLGEVHEDFNLNIELAKHGFWVYDFALPFLLLHALKFRTAEALRHWLSICPRRQITTLDTHDGMGVDDVAGLAPLVDVREVENAILCLGGTVNHKHFYDPKSGDECQPDNNGDGETDCKDCSETSRDALFAVKDYLEPDCLEGCYVSVQHQYNCTYFSATKEDPRLYLMARAVQFFTPGVPMVYYVGLLAGRNDYELLEKGSIRDINRHTFSVEEAEKAVRRPVVQALLKLCRFRNYHPAFTGRVFIDDTTPPHLLRVCWYSGTKHLAVLRADFQAREFSISHTPYKTPMAVDASAEEVELEDEFDLNMSEVFKVDALDLVERAEERMQLDDSVADLGIVDPLELVAMHRAKQQINTAKSNGAGNGSSNGSTGNGTSADSSSTAGSSSQRSTPHTASSGSLLGFASGGIDSLGRYDPETDRFVGGSAGVSTNGYVTTGEEQLAVDRNAVDGEVNVDGNGGMTKKGAEWGLLQLDLSFAWKMEDKPVEDVDIMLQGATAQAPAVAR